MPYKQPNSMHSNNGNGAARPAYTPDPEVKATRRRYPVWYKLQLLEQADTCTEPGEIGALLRKEGLYHTTLTHFRRQRALGLLNPPQLSLTQSLPEQKPSRNTSPNRNVTLEGSNKNGNNGVSPLALEQNPQSWEDQARHTMELERENRELKRKLKQAEGLLELQKKVAALLGDSLETERQTEEPEAPQQTLQLPNRPTSATTRSANIAPAKLANPAKKRGR